MLWNLKQLQGCHLKAFDGEIGQVGECLFDDRDWVVRYVVVRASWLQGRTVFISPRALGRLDMICKVLAVNLTQQRIRHSPSIATDLPISREQAEDYNRYYGWPAGSGGLDSGTAPASRLRSTREVTGYTLQIDSNVVGHVEDFLVDDAIWTISSIVMASQPAWCGKNVLVSPQSIIRAVWDIPGRFIIQRAMA
jgi:hypothetical protein